MGERCDIKKHWRHAEEKWKKERGGIEKQRKLCKSFTLTRCTIMLLVYTVHDMDDIDMDLFACRRKMLLLLCNLRECTHIMSS